MMASGKGIEGCGEAGMKIAYLGLGSNLGDREANLRQAIAALSHHDVRVLKQSSFYETEPREMTDQGWFLNCVVEVETRLMPVQLLHVLLSIERAMGRKRLVKSGPRIIDMDILLYATSIIRSPDLEVPHPRMAERRFVLAPLIEIGPDLRHPVLQKTVTELLPLLGPEDGVVRLWCPAGPPGAQS
jgi:2-amino-4-hydroxy-6-hydroxymethyldihydropteridine diphosphokinase